MRKTKTIKTLILLLAITFLFSSCNNDDDDNTIITPNSEGSITIEGPYDTINTRVRYNYTKGFIIKPHSSYYDNYRYFYIAFTDGDISLVNNELKYSDNTTFIASFKLAKSNNSSLGAIEEGKYYTWSANTDADKFINAFTIIQDVQVENGDIVSGDVIDMSYNDYQSRFNYLDLNFEEDVFDIFYQIHLTGGTNPFAIIVGDYKGLLTEIE